MTTKAPNVGTKVATGENIPTTREAPGNVPEGSLAAESARKGGAFASNPDQHEQAPQKRSQQQQHPQPQSSSSPSQTGGTADKTTSLNLENQQTARGTGTGTGQEHQQQTRGQGTGGGKKASESGTGTGTGGLETQQSHRGAAAGGPHGKNLTEGGFEGSGTEAGPLPEPGSAEDPGRAAVAGGRGRAAGAGAGGVEEGSWYTPLKGDEPA
ncbi:hypothetical protein B0I37DRAFT_199273 [Chaetomium sp. MPI-CAGE-AT-0009]|nr:hypothetical protein B0I37DRAFT_199273 [Chaetomium sp. MPI-CAGE-AT-0009]